MGINPSPSRVGQDGSAPVALLVGVISLFFVWGGITSLNDILIPKLKGLFQLGYTQAMLTQFAFFTAYALVSLPAGVVVGRLGYGRGIVLGLSMMAAGCLLFVPAASFAAYGLFLGALFVLASGITVLQVAANPLIANLGPARTASSRLTFAQAFNSLGTAIWPFVGAKVILGSVATTDPATLDGAGLIAFQAREATIVGQSYLGIAAILCVLGLLFWFARDRLAATDEPMAIDVSGSLALLRRPRVRFGVLAIFAYVGAEVTIGSFMVNYLMQDSVMALSQRDAGGLIALYWSGAMIGRFVGTLVLRRVLPGMALGGAALCAAGLVMLSVSTTGAIAGWGLIAVGLANAIMFPTIFSLALDRLGERTAQGSGLLCMAIVGGAVVPFLSGAVADAHSLRLALLLPIMCYLLVAAFGWSSRRPIN